MLTYPISYCYIQYATTTTLLHVLAIDYTNNVLLGFCHGMCHIVPCNKGLTMSGVMGSTLFQTKL
jgi:hypothetical protein